ncbi:MAG TPA: MraY family glycosyltransferase [Candidatus Polarisedimenticolaceae bacterium]
MALVVAAGILPAVIRFARHVGAVDAPGGRRIHVGEIPRLGGIGIFLGFVGGVGAALLFTGRAQSLGEPTSPFPWVGAGFGASLIFLTGLLDDLFQLSPRTKLLCQIGAALVAVGFGVRVETLAIPFGSTLDLGPWSPAITLAWILVVTNALNLLDGLDGLAGGFSLIVTLTMASVALRLNHFGVVVCAAALTGALVAFLRYNFNPAKIFMGDGGSQFLGFLLAILSIRGSIKEATAVTLLLPLMVLGLPLADLGTTVLRRAVRGGRATPLSLLRRIAHADREHLHHNLIDLGLSPRRAVLSLYLIAATFALAGYLSVGDANLPLAALVLAASVAGIAAIKLAPSLAKGEPSAGPSEGA